MTPAQRFQPAPDEQRELLPLWLPGALQSVSEPAGTPTAQEAVDAGGAAAVPERGPVEFDRVIRRRGTYRWQADSSGWGPPGLG